MEPLYQVHWKSQITGATGHGTGKFPKAEAEKYAERFNEQYKNIRLVYWAEPAEAEKNEPQP